MNATSSCGPDDGADRVETPGIPPALRRATAFILPVAASGFLQHFLEAFLARAEKWLRLPWWLAHAGLYVATGLLIMRFGQPDELLPHNCLVTLWGILAAEYAFTTGMLVHLRE